MEIQDTSTSRMNTMPYKRHAKRRNDVKARTTLLLALPDEHQLRFNKYKTAQEWWTAILKTFGGNEATRKTKKNQLKQQYGNFKAEGKETLEQTFNRLQAIVYEPEVPKKLESNSQNMTFISSAKNSSGNEEVNTASIPTLALKFPLLIKYEDINQIDEDGIEEIDIKWNMTLLSMRADRYTKKTGKKISIQSIDVVGFDKLKVECFNCHKMGHFARECRVPRSQEKGERRDNYRQRSKVEEQALKALMAINGVGWDWSYMENEEENHALFEARLVEFKNQEIKFCEKIRGLEFKVESKANRIENLTNELETLKKEKEGLYSKLTSFKSASKDLDNLLESQRSDKNKEGLGYSDVPPPPAQVYSPPKKDMSWTGLLEFADDTITNYSRPSPAIESNSYDPQNRNPSVTENEASSSTILSKPTIKFVKAS
nr:hypothetical protein [Tanacetum cinerariifolium]